MQSGQGVRSVPSGTSAFGLVAVCRIGFGMRVTNLVRHPANRNERFCRGARNRLCLLVAAGSTANSTDGVAYVTCAVCIWPPWPGRHGRVTTSTRNRIYFPSTACVSIPVSVIAFSSRSTCKPYPGGVYRQVRISTSSFPVKASEPYRGPGSAACPKMVDKTALHRIVTQISAVAPRSAGRGRGVEGQVAFVSNMRSRSGNKTDHGKDRGN